MVKVNPNVIPFSFKQSTEETIENMNDKLPINIKKWERFIERVSKRYPYISKSDVSFIVKATLKTIRNMLVAGYSFNLYGFAEGMKLKFYTVTRLGKIHPALKVKLYSSNQFNEGQNNGK